MHLKLFRSANRKSNRILWYVLVICWVQFLNVSGIELRGAVGRNYCGHNRNYLRQLSGPFYYFTLSLLLLVATHYVCYLLHILFIQHTCTAISTRLCNISHLWMRHLPNLSLRHRVTAHISACAIYLLLTSLLAPYITCSHLCFRHILPAHISACAIYLGLTSLSASYIFR